MNKIFSKGGNDLGRYFGEELSKQREEQVKGPKAVLYLACLKNGKEDGDVE